MNARLPKNIENTVTPIVTLDDVVTFLAEQPEQTEFLEKMQNYRAQYGVKR